MRSWVANAILMATMGAVAMHAPLRAQQSSPFTGKWKLNVAKSSGELAKEEYVILDNTSTTEHCINDITGPDGKRTRNEYRATYDDGKWHPGKSLDTGKPYGSNMLIRLTPRSEIRLGKTTSNDVAFMVIRTVAEDGKTMQITQLSPDGKVVANLFLEKQ
jgi:hypothetical protein